MSVTLRILLIMASAATVIWILYKIRRLKVKMEDTIFWIFFAGVLLLMGVFPEIVYKLTDMIGIMSPANLVFLIMIIILFEKVFTLSIIVSQLEEKITVLSAEVALRSHETAEEHEQKIETEVEKVEAEEKEEMEKLHG